MPKRLVLLPFSSRAGVLLPLAPILFYRFQNTKAHCQKREKCCETQRSLRLPIQICIQKQPHEPRQKRQHRCLQIHKNPPFVTHLALLSQNKVRCLLLDMKLVKGWKVSTFSALFFFRYTPMESVGNLSPSSATSRSTAPCALQYYQHRQG